MWIRAAELRFGVPRAYLLLMYNPRNERVSGRYVAELVFCVLAALFVGASAGYRWGREDAPQMSATQATDTPRNHEPERVLHARGRPVPTAEGRH